MKGMTSVANDLVAVLWVIVPKVWWQTQTSSALDIDHSVLGQVSAQLLLGAFRNAEWNTILHWCRLGAYYLRNTEDTCNALLAHSLAQHCGLSSQPFNLFMTKDRQAAVYNLSLMRHHILTEKWILPPFVNHEKLLTFFEKTKSLLGIGVINLLFLSHLSLFYLFSTFYKWNVFNS